MGWKVHRLTKKEFCHSNETWHAFNSTFHDTICIVSFQINPHWISNSGLWKGVLETFWRWPGKLTKGVLFHQDNAPAHKSVVAVRDSGFKLVVHPPYSPDLAPSDYFLFPTGSGWELLYHRNPTSKHCSTDGRSMWTAGLLENKPHLVKFDHCIIVSLWTFQPTLVDLAYCIFTCNKQFLNVTAWMRCYYMYWRFHSVSLLKPHLDMMVV